MGFFRWVFLIFFWVGFLGGFFNANPDFFGISQKNFQNLPAILRCAFLSCLPCPSFEI
jgi:hypothetical protein